MAWVPLEYQKDIVISLIGTQNLFFKVYGCQWNITKIFSGLWHGWPWNINCCGVSGEVGGKWNEFAILVGVCLPSEALR